MSANRYNFTASQGRTGVSFPEGVSRKPKDAGKTKPGNSNVPGEAVLSRAQEVFQNQPQTRKTKKISILDQWHEITVEDGETVTRAYPSNEDLIKRGRKMNPPPTYVYRRLNFVKHIPPEYVWVTNNPDRRRNGGFCVQRMTVETWLAVIEREAANGDGHIGMTGVGNMPRPKERGTCSCPVCTANADLFPGI